MAVARLVQKSALYFVTAGESPTLMKIANLLQVPQEGGQKTEIDVTNLDSDRKEFLLGLEDGGSITVNVNYDPSEASHAALRALKDAGTASQFVVCYSDGTSAPTYSTGTITPPTDRTGVVFNALVQGFAVTGDVDNVLKAAVTLRVTGAATYFVPSGG